METEYGFLDDLSGWWDRITTDDPNSGIYDEWGTGSPGDLSPGLGNRWIARNTDSDDVLDLAVDTARDAGKEIAQEGGGFVGAATGGLFGVSPIVLLLIVGGAYLAFRKVTG